MFRCAKRRFQILKGGLRVLTKKIPGALGNVLFELRAFPCAAKQVFFRPAAILFQFLFIHWFSPRECKSSLRCRIPARLPSSWC